MSNEQGYNEPDPAIGYVDEEVGPEPDAEYEWQYKSRPFEEAMQGRHPGTRAIMRWFETGHLTGRKAHIVAEFRELALNMVENLPDDPELVAGIRNLVEAKDCIVRAEVARERGGFDG